MKWKVPLERPSGAVSQGSPAMGGARVFQTVIVEAGTAREAAGVALRDHPEAHSVAMDGVVETREVGT